MSVNMSPRIVAVATYCYQSGLEETCAFVEPVWYQIQLGQCQSAYLRPSQEKLVDSGSSLSRRKHLRRQHGGSDSNKTYALFASVSTAICDSSSATLSASFEALGCSAALAVWSVGKGSSYSQS